MKGLKYLCSLLKKKEKVIFFLGDVNGFFFLLKYILYCFGKFVYYILIIFIWLKIFWLKKGIYLFVKVCFLMF